MELFLVRDRITAVSATGILYGPDKKAILGYTLEDTDRGLLSRMPLSEIKRLKKKGATAIPRGRYEVVISFSNRFKTYLPELVNVPGFDGIRIHPGNTSKDVEGCIALGVSRTTDWVSQSVVAFTSWLNYVKDFFGIKVTSRKGLWPLIDLIKDVKTVEKVYITIS